MNRQYRDGRIHSLRRKAGVLLLDWPIFEWHLRRDPLAIRNRNERLKKAPDGRGVQCCWRWTSELNAPKVFPALGRRLMRRMLLEHPVIAGWAAGGVPSAVRHPEVSFVIGHRGKAREPHLLATLNSIAAQRGVAVECLVVEQSAVPEIRERLPGWVRYLHTPLADPDLPYCRSWALNAGAGQARGRLLILHDSDLLVPQSYASECWRLFQAGYEVVNLKRFIFYLSEAATLRACGASSPLLEETAEIECVVQNTEGGGSIAIGRDAFFELGGFDEEFVGWGGEDNEFWERCALRRRWEYGYLPLVHLWHRPQSRKWDPDNPALARYRILAALDPGERVRRLLAAAAPHLPAGPAPQALRLAMIQGLVSTIIPVHNRPEMLREAVESVLAQTYRPIEIVIVDDGSTDETTAVGEAFQASHPDTIRFLRKGNGGPGLAREAGRRLARGEFIQYLDSDDLLLPNKFACQVAGLRSRPDCGVSYGMTAYVATDRSSSGRPWKRTGEVIERMFPSFLVSRWWGTSTPLYRRSVLEEVGPWADLSNEEDWEYDCRVAAQGVRLHYCPCLVSEQRDHPGDRLSRSGTVDRSKLMHRARAHALIYQHAARAGITCAEPEMQHFARELFLLSRQCGSRGLEAQSRELFGLARVASGPERGNGADFRFYGWFASHFGWARAGFFACWTDRLRPRVGRQ